jgi:DNA-binding GntR family transcriptional regulator
MTSSAAWMSNSSAYVKPTARDVWADEAAHHGAIGTQRLIAAGPESANEAVARLLQVTEGQEVVGRHRLIQSDDNPVELASTYYPSRIASGTPLARDAKIRGGAVACLAELGHAPAFVKEEVGARLPAPDEQERLRLNWSEPVLTLDRITYDAAHRIIQVDRMVAPAKCRRLQYELKVD